MDKAFIANIIVIVLELAGFYASRSRGVTRLVFYTQISNIVAMISSVCYLINGDASFTIALRYLGTVMLALTALITLFVLVPSGAGLFNMMVSGNGLYHHTLCPAISITSYILWEQHSAMWPLPVAVTIIYGLAMLYVNYKRIFEGPYPFFKVHEQSVKATVIWMTALVILITIISVALVLPFK